MSWKIFGGKGDISIMCVTVVSGEGVYLLILFLHIFISDLRMLSDSIIIKTLYIDLKKKLDYLQIQEYEY